jgi:hypothetical protein
VKYLEDDCADGGTSLHSFDRLNVATGSKSSVPETVVIVEATHGHCIDIAQFHFYDSLFLIF